MSNDVEVGIPEQYSLSQNYPNPFNPVTKIDYALSSDGRVNLTLYDISGRVVSNIINEFKTAGYYTVNVNASDLPSGIYFYIIRAVNLLSKKMLLN
ncbi:MAG: T9SS type A sorting domain-containing protein [Ignavibacteria bacterium]|nr:T9SS type A sorting domain-containing protein [Ignavibacteria bacterium]